MKQIKLVEWVDSIGCPGGWQIWDKPEVPSPITSVGWELHRTSWYLVLCPTGYELPDGKVHTMGVLSIPLCSVVREVDLVPVITEKEVCDGQKV